MASQYKVSAVLGTSQWQSQHGPMLAHEMNVENLTEGTSGFVTVNSKPGKSYTPGEEFWAETAGEYRGVLKLKRVQAPQAARPAPTPSQPAHLPAAAPQAALPGIPARKAMPYSDAMALVAKLAEDVKNDGLLIAMFRSIVDGSIENPLAKPKTIVRYYGNDLETAGIEQAAWDEIDALSKEMIAETDEKNVKALLIATCMVQSRKDLTAEKAKLFAQTLRTNLKLIRDQREKEKADWENASDPSVPF